MKKISIILTTVFLSLLPLSVSANAYAVNWFATSTTQGWIAPNTINGLLQTPYAQNFIASSSINSIFPNFLFTIATGTSATTTNFFSTNLTSTLASTTQFFGANLQPCSAGTNALTWTGGSFGCNTISAGTGTVTSVATNNGLTGGTITTSGTIGLNISSLSTNALVGWNGSNLTATGTQQLTVGSILATTSTFSLFTGGLETLASSTFQGFTFTNATGTSATTTNLSISSNAITMSSLGGFVNASSTISGNFASSTMDAITGNTPATGTTTLVAANLPTSIKLLGFYCTASTTGTAFVDFSHDNGNVTQGGFCGSYIPVSTNNTWTVFEDFDVQASSTAGKVNRISVTGVYLKTSP